MSSGWLTLGLPRQANYKCSRMDKGSHYEGKAFIYSKKSVTKSKNKTSEEDEDTEGHEWEKGH